MIGIPEMCTIHYAIILPAQIGYLRFILEAYEGIAVLSTIDPRLGLVRLNIAPGMEEYVERIMQTEREILGLRFLKAGIDSGGPLGLL